MTSISQQARWVTRTARAKEQMVAKTASARTVFAGLERGCEMLVLTHGQFSSGDAVAALLDRTGPADVSFATWTAATLDIERAAEFLSDGRILSCRWLVDRSFATRQPAYCALLRERFGDDTIRTARSHAKFATIRNDEWDLAVRTSMNLNSNPRLEVIEVSDSPELADLLDETFAVVFDGRPAGELNGQLPEVPDRGVPKLRAGRGVAVGPR